MVGSGVWKGREEMMSRCWEMNKEIATEGRERTTLVIYWPNNWQNAACYTWKIRIFPNNSWIWLGDFQAECYNCDLAFYSYV